MATPNQDVGLGDERIFAGDTLCMSFAVTTGGTAAGVTAASYKIADKAPTLAGTTLVEKTIGNGVTVTDGATAGVVDIAVVLIARGQRRSDRPGSYRLIPPRTAASP